MNLSVVTFTSIVSVLFFEWRAERQKKIDYMVNLLNMRAILKRCYYDKRQKKQDLQRISRLIKELQNKLVSSKKKLVVPLVTVHGNIEYLTILRQEIIENGYEGELRKLSKQDQLLDNWDDF